jgi:hypothetical protein
MFKLKPADGVDAKLTDQIEYYPDPDDPVPLFIYDKYHVGGLWINPNIDYDKYKDDINTIILDIKADNCIAFERPLICPSMFLMDLEYCGWFSIMDVTIHIDKFQPFAMVYWADTYRKDKRTLYY